MLHENCEPAGVGFGIGEIGGGAREIRFRLANGFLVGAAINLEKELALGDGIALGEVDLGQLTGDQGFDVDGRVGLHISDGADLNRDGPLGHGGYCHGHGGAFGRGVGGGGLLAARRYDERGSDKNSQEDFQCFALLPLESKMLSLCLKLPSAPGNRSGDLYYFCLDAKTVGGVSNRWSGALGALQITSAGS